jgi:hypothetical protein
LAALPAWRWSIDAPMTVPAALIGALVAIRTKRRRELLAQRYV